MFALKKYTAD